MHSHWKNWTLFLDRDGVINKRIIGGYVCDWSQWQFLPGSLEAIVELSEIFNHVFVVTNQQGVGKGKMEEEDLERIHSSFLEEVRKSGGKITEIFYCTQLESETPNCRKPSPSMGLRAKNAYPEIVFENSVMVGDSRTDLEFGRALNMHTVHVVRSTEQEKTPEWVDLRVDDLKEFSDRATQGFSFLKK